MAMSVIAIVTATSELDPDWSSPGVVIFLSSMVGVFRFAEVEYVENIEVVVDMIILEVVSTLVTSSFNS